MMGFSGQRALLNSTADNPGPSHELRTIQLSKMRNYLIQACVAMPVTAA